MVGGSWSSCGYNQDVLLSDSNQAAAAGAGWLVGGDGGAKSADRLGCLGGGCVAAVRCNMTKKTMGIGDVI